jgi:hypothetical protein
MKMKIPTLEEAAKNYALEAARASHLTGEPFEILTAHILKAILSFSETVRMERDALSSLLLSVQEECISANIRAGDVERKTDAK